MENHDEKVLEVSNLCKNYGNKKALDNVTFSVNKGDVVGFLGPNGAGKSTAMNIITGYLSPSSGSVSVCGINTLEDPVSAKKKIGYLPEIPPLYQDMTVLEYLEFVYELKKCTLDKKQHILSCMSLVKITHVANRLIKNLSKGYKQRVGMAQALIGDPEILILDEPTVGLDPKQIIEMRDVIRVVGEKRTVIISTHILQEVTAVCNKVVIISGGKVRVCDLLENLERSCENKLKVVISARSEEADKILSSIGCEYEKPSEREYIIQSESDIREEIFKAFAGSGIVIIELTPLSRTIEDVFRDYTDDSIAVHEDAADDKPNAQTDDEQTQSELSKDEAQSNENPTEKEKNENESNI